MRTPILTYHAVGEGPPPLWISRRGLADQLDALLASGRACWRVVDLVAALAAGRKIPAEAMVLTFDDGYRGVHRDALPELAARGLVATVYPVAGRIGGDNRWPGQPASVPTAPLLGWDELAELVAAGWEIGAHGLDHRRLTGVDPAAAEHEMTGARRLLAERLGVEVQTFAYPYGAVDATVEALAARRFAGAVGTRLGYVVAGTDLYDLPRLDAYYLDAGRVARLDALRTRGYLGVRRVLRGVRRAAARRPGDEATDG